MNRDDPQFWLNQHYIDKWDGPEAAVDELYAQEWLFFLKYGHWYDEDS